MESLMWKILTEGKVDFFKNGFYIGHVLLNEMLLKDILALDEELKADARCHLIGWLKEMYFRAQQICAKEAFVGKWISLDKAFKKEELGFSYSNSMRFFPVATFKVIRTDNPEHFLFKVIDIDGKFLFIDKNTTIKIVS